MSGICGYVSFGRPPGREDLAPVLDRLAFRGPDGCRVRAGDGAVLGHALLATTPEAEVEVQPWEHRESGCVITADARLDNREDLASALSVDLRARVVGDAELILRAWLRWRQDCPTHLLGDFAFAIWDERARQLFCARDPMGMRQIIWGMPRPDTLVFATDARAVRAAAPDRFPLNEARIGDYLEDFEGIDEEVTFFSGVTRLPPARRLTFDRTGVNIDRYWTLQPRPIRAGLSDAEHEEGFREVFAQAIEARLRSNRPVASMLSGGMDSSSVAAVAAGLLAAEGRGPLITVSAIGPDPGTCPETRYAGIAWTMPGIESHAVDHSRLDELMPELVAQFRDMGEPFDYCMSLPRAVFLRAAKLGARVVLDGASGDIVLHPGDLRGRLVRQGRLGAAWRDIQGERAFFRGLGRSATHRLAAAAWRAFMPMRVRRLRHDLIGRIERDSIVAPEFARRVGMAERRRRMNAYAGGQDMRRRAILHPNGTVGTERYERVAAQSAVEPRDPFRDLRVIDYLLGTPAALICADGWPKGFLRRAMAGRVPDAIRWRRGKEHLGFIFTRAVFGPISHEWPPTRFRTLVEAGKGIDLSGGDNELAVRLAALGTLATGEEE